MLQLLLMLHSSVFLCQRTSTILMLHRLTAGDTAVAAAAAAHDDVARSASCIVFVQLRFQQAQRRGQERVGIFLLFGGSSSGQRVRVAAASGELCVSRSK